MTDRSTAADGRVVDCWSDLTKDQQSHLLALRGLLAMRTLLHCLEKRHRVDFGVNR